MHNDRPNPDALLARVQEESSRAHRGKLKIFFGYAAGVGKTYEMLSAASITPLLRWLSGDELGNVLSAERAAAAPAGQEALQLLA